MENPLSRYLPQITLPEIGVDGQRKLKDARVLVVGAGGLGNTVLAILNAMGLGCLGIADFDNVALSNLHRQFLYNEIDVGQSKVLVLAAKLSAQNPATLIQPFSESIGKENAEIIVAGFDLVCDCTDNLESRLVLNEACGALKKPLIFGSASGFEGYITILHGVAEIGLDDLSWMYSGTGNNCTISGVFSPVVSLIAGLQASESVKVILGLEGLLDGKILCVDLLNNTFRSFKLLKAT